MATLVQCVSQVVKSSQVAKLVQCYEMIVLYFADKETSNTVQKNDNNCILFHTNLFLKLTLNKLYIIDVNKLGNEQILGIF